MCRAVFCACVLALAVAACSGSPLREDVIAQANQRGEVAFDVVKIDDAVIATLAERPRPSFRQRFKKYEPPPDIKIAVGDTVSVVIWESAANGLFGTSITEWSVPSGAAALLGFGQSPGGVRPSGTQRVFPGSPAGSDELSPDRLAQLLGGAASGDAASAASALLAPGAAASRGRESPTLALGSPAALRLRELAEQTGRPGTRIPLQRVGSDGAISIPYAGRIKVAGRTPDEVARRIEQRLGPKALDPQVLVTVAESAANTVTVAGEIVGGKRVPLSPGGDRLLAVIAAAGGAKAPVHETIVRLSRRGVTATVPLSRLVAEPDENIFAEPGDVLTLARRPQTFTVFGAAGKNAAITFASERLSLTEALAKAGGLLDNKADPRAVFLLRYEPVPIVRALGQPVAAKAPAGVSPVAYRLDLQETRSYLLAKQFPVQDKDVIFVAEAEAVPVTRALQAFSLITGPVTSGLLICQTSKEC